MAKGKSNKVCISLEKILKYMIEFMTIIPVIKDKNN